MRRLDRISEFGAILEHLADWLERERVDLCLMSGDVFDSTTPPPEAERLVYDFFKRVGRAGIPCVVIAGNHDSPTRVEAWGSLAELVGVRAVGRPASVSMGGLQRIVTPCGETALVAAIPFAPPSKFASALDLAGGPVGMRDLCARGLEALIREVTGPFDPSAVNLLMLHTHVQGVAFSGSERIIHLGDEWTASPSSLPAVTQYVALGHVHRPQAVPGFPCPAEYAGSAMQLDFGEAGEEKSFVVIEAHPGREVRLTRVPYRGGRALLRHRGSLDELERDAPWLREAGWLAITVPLASADPDVNGAVRRLLPNAVKVEVELPVELAVPGPLVSRTGRPPDELFADYLARRDGRPPDPDVIDQFRRLHAAAEAEGA
jgi:exonuclease SbcD